MDANEVKKRPRGKGKSKVDYDYITTLTKRRVAFSKRKAGLMKKASELASMTGAQVLVIVVSEAKSVYAYSTPEMSGLVHSEPGQEALKGCLNMKQEGSVQVQTSEDNNFDQQ